MDHDYDKLATTVLINPRSAIPIHPFYFSPLKTSLLPEDWVEANERLINDMGNADWLWRLLAILQHEPTDDLTDIVINPRQAVVFAESLSSPDIQRLVDPEGWVRGNSDLLSKLGTGDWLRLLLKTLEQPSLTQ